MIFSYDGGKLGIVRIKDDECFVEFARWRHRWGGEVWSLRLHLVIGSPNGQGGTVYGYVPLGRQLVYAGESMINEEAD